MQEKHRPPLKSGGGGGTSDGMDGRVSKLEAYMEVTRGDLADIKSDLKGLIETSQKLATKADVEAWKWQWVGIALTVIALSVGSIVGGLALIAHASS